MSGPKPARSYLETVTPSRESSIAMRVHADPTALEVVINQERIDKAEVLSLTQKHRIAFGEQDLHELTRALNIMRATRPADDPFERDDVHREFEEYQAVVKRLAGRVADLEEDLNKLIDANHPAEENLVHIKRGSNAGVISINTTLLTRFRSQATQTAEYLRRWSSASPSFRSVTWHGDIVYLAQLLDQAAARAGGKVSFTDPDTRGVKFIEEALMRAAVIGNAETNRASIFQALRRHKAKVAKLLATLTPPIGQ